MSRLLETQEADPQIAWPSTEACAFTAGDVLDLPGGLLLRRR